MINSLKKFFKRGIDTTYLSPDDAFINQLHAQFNDSPAQLREIAKHRRIAQRRDDPNYPQNKDEIWSEF